MILIPIIALLLGILVGAVVVVDLPIAFAPYAAIIIMAGLDALSGGSRSLLEGKFLPTVFLTGFLANTMLGLFLIWLGDGLGVALLTPAAIVFGMRMFTNLSVIRRVLLRRYEDFSFRRKRDIEESSEAAS